MGVKSGLGDIKSTSLEAKAGLLGVIYGLERMTAASAVQGTTMKQYEAYTGQSLETLGKWQYILGRTGVTADETRASHEALFSTMSNIHNGLGAPQGFGIFMNAVGIDKDKMMNLDYMIAKAQEFAKIASPVVGNSVLGAMGLGKGVIQGYRENKMSLDQVPKGVYWSEKEASNLQKVDVMWADLWKRIQMMEGRKSLKYSLFAVGELNHAISGLEKFGKELGKFSDQHGKVTVIAEALAGIAMLSFAPLTTAIVGITAFLAKMDEHKKDKGGFWGFMNNDHLEKDIGGWVSGLFSGGVGMVVDEKGKKRQLNDYERIVPGTRAAAPGSSSVTNINQNITHHGDAKDTKAVADTHKQGIKDAYRQNPAQFLVK